ncbi:MAG: alanine--glyoxylate aminotransferase family protein, partial [Anaerolineae bacterium]|nr:alanine--glyoxylate aminotransferase family protein [Anaerolineae bacterium]
MELRIPGPTPLPAKVRQALAGEMVGHRSAEFGALLREITAELRQWFQTEEDVLLLTASGT